MLSSSFVPFRSALICTTMIKRKRNLYLKSKHNSFGWNTMLCCSSLVYGCCFRCNCCWWCDLISCLDNWLVGWRFGPLTFKPYIYFELIFCFSWATFSFVFFSFFPRSDFTLINAYLIATTRAYTHKNIIHSHCSIWNLCFLLLLRQLYTAVPIYSIFCFTHVDHCSSFLLACNVLLLWKRNNTENDRHLSRTNETITIMLNVWFVDEIWMSGWVMTLLINERNILLFLFFVDSNCYHSSMPLFWQCAVPCSAMRHLYINSWNFITHILFDVYTITNTMHNIWEHWF